MVLLVKTDNHACMSLSPVCKSNLAGKQDWIQVGKGVHKHAKKLKRKQGGAEKRRGVGFGPDPAVRSRVGGQCAPPAFFSYSFPSPSVYRCIQPTMCTVFHYNWCQHMDELQEDVDVNKNQKLLQVIFKSQAQFLVSRHVTCWILLYLEIHCKSNFGITKWSISFPSSSS